MSNLASIILSGSIILLTGAIIFLGFSIVKRSRICSEKPQDDVGQRANVFVSDAARIQVTTIWVAAFNHAVTQHEKLTSFMRIVALAAIVMWTGLATQQVMQINHGSLAALAFLILGLLFSVGPCEMLAYGSRDIARDISSRFNSGAADMDRLPETTVAKKYFVYTIPTWLFITVGFGLMVYTLLPTT